MLLLLLLKKNHDFVEHFLIWYILFIEFSLNYIKVPNGTKSRLSPHLKT